MSMPSSILWEYLIETAGLFSNPANGTAWPLYDGNLPDGNATPNVAAALFNTSGLLEGKDMHSNLDQRYGIQVALRCFSESDGYDKAKEVQNSVKDIHNEDISIVSGETWRILNVHQTSPIVKIGIDEKGRTLHTINFLLCMVLI